MKKILASFLIVCMGLSTFASAHWADSYLNELADKKIIFGDEMGFRADDPLLRCEFAAMLNRAFSFSAKKVPNMIDIDESKWYYNDFYTLCGAGILEGDSNGLLNPENIITRAEAAVMLGRALNVDDLSETTPNNEDIPDWSYGKVGSLLKLGVLNGYPDGNFYGNHTLLRGEAASLLANALKVFGYEDGDGTKENPYRIYTFQQLKNIKQNLNGHYKLEADIDFLNQEFPVIGDYENDFTGTFDGNGHRIVIRYAENGTNALFAKTSEQAVIKNTYLVCPLNRFSLVAENYGQILNSANTSFVKREYDDTRNYGGIAQINFGKISDCYSTSSVYSKGTGYKAGGIAGINYGEILNTFHTGEIGAYCGGIAGENRGEISDSYSVNGKVAYSNTGRQFNTYSGKNAISSFSSEKFEISGDVLCLKNVMFFKNEDFTLFSGGDGSAQNPYRISDGKQFSNISDKPESSYLQINDIHVSDFVKSFRGTYDGNGFVIKSLRILDDFDGKSAMFIENLGTIKKVIVSDGYIHGANRSAGIVFDNYGTIELCAFSGEIAGTDVSGLCFTNHENALVSQCYFSGRASAQYGAAGICGNNNGEILNVYSSADIMGKFIGGLVYNNYGVVSDSYFGGSVTGDGAGIANSNSGRIKDSYSLDIIPVFSDYGAIEGVEVRSDTQMRSFSGFPGLDFYVIWDIDKAKGYSYPTLKNVLHNDMNNEQNTSDFSGGNGSVVSPYRIVTPAQLACVSKYPSSNFILMNDIDLANYPEFSITDKFYGIFDGNGKSILNLNKSQDNSSLFGENYGLIQNLYVKNGVVSGENSAPLCIINDGTIRNCMFEGSINNTGAGIVIKNLKEIIECVSSGSYKGKEIAGISLLNEGKIVNSYSVAEIVADKSFGIAKGRNGKIESCWFGGLMISKSITPVSDCNYENSFYLDFYSLRISDGKTFSSPLNVKFYQSPWVIVSGQPVLSSMPLPDGLSSMPQGNGTKENPYLISCKEDLKFIGMYRDKEFRLESNIFADNNELLSVDTFSGTLDGNGKGIYDFSINSKNGGLFRELTGTVKNLTLSKFSISGTEETGGITALNKGIIENCTIKSGRIGTSGTYSGGICGINTGSGLVKNCSNQSDVFSASSSGGICGNNEGLIILSNNTGGVIASAEVKDACAGGIAGKSLGVIEKCFNNGKIFSYSETGESASGGIIGSGGSTLSYVYNTGEINAKAKQYAYTGGICGKADKIISLNNAYNIGFTNPTATSALAGSAVALAQKGGEIYGFVYEHTLAETVGTGEISQQFVLAQPIDLMIRDAGFMQFDFNSVWGFNYDNKYYYPQIIGNEQDKIVIEENDKDFAGGDGSLENPYKIMTPEQLNHVRHHLGATFMLLGDIDMTNYCKNNKFMPIGDSVFSFFGLFIGNNYKITGLKFQGEDFGLFRENHGEIYNLFIENASGEGSGGAICVSNTGLIYNCAVSGKMIADSEQKNISRGGLVGVNKGTGMIISSYSTADIEISAQNSRAGGIVCENYGIISGTFSSGNISSNGSNLALSGGVSAANLGIVSDCYATGEVNSSSKIETSYSGGISSTNTGSVVNCYYNGASVSGKKFGDILASNAGTLVNCYFAGNQGLGDNSGNISRLIKCTHNELKQKETFVDFDFQNMWIMDESFNYQYPQFVEIAHRYNN